MQHINQAGLAIIKAYEGFAPKPYLCPAGYMTIGYGHRVREQETFPNPITDQEAETLLLSDVALAEKAIRNRVGGALNGNQFSALVSFVFNVGAGAFAASTLLKKINAGQHQAIPGELRRWVYAKGTKLPGLVKRREAEGRLYISV